MLRKLETKNQENWNERVAFSKGSNNCSVVCNAGNDSGQGGVYAEGRGFPSKEAKKA